MTILFFMTIKINKINTRDTFYLFDIHLLLLSVINHDWAYNSLAILIRTLFWSDKINKTLLLQPYETHCEDFVGIVSNIMMS